MYEPLLFIGSKKNEEKVFNYLYTVTPLYFRRKYFCLSIFDNCGWRLKLYNQTQDIKK